MAGDLSRWMGAVGDVDLAHKSANNPSMLRKVLNAKSIEEEAIEAFLAKKQLEQQRNDLRTFIQFSQAIWVGRTPTHGSRHTKEKTKRDIRQENL